VTIPYGRQEINQSDVDAVVEVLTSDFLTQGPAVPAFENVLAQYCGVPHGVAVNSATSALHIACMALGLGAGDELWTSPNTFVASANCALYCGARVDFVDTDERSYNMSVPALKAKLEAAALAGRRPKIVVPVHLSGQSCDMAGIAQLAEQFGFAVIEDASHAVGGRYLGEPIGNCRYSDAVVFSFHPVKIITTAEGGMVMTRNDNLSALMRRFRSHGITREADLMTKETEGAWYYQQLELGYNYRMTELQAALGLSQFNRLDQYVARRHHLASRYKQALRTLPLTMPWQHPDSHSALHLYPVVLHDVTRRRAVFDHLRAAGIGVNVHYIPVHLQPHYAAMGFKAGDFPQAERYYAGAISLPMYPSLTEDQQDEVVRVLGQALA
jgi:UDP-4-amino-4,6-dideoxy-N-acetyl-beta-L-altrosamine transaminase